MNTMTTHFWGLLILAKLSIMSNDTIWAAVFTILAILAMLVGAAQSWVASQKNKP
jgi:hypothetical protein